MEPNRLYSIVDANSTFNWSLRGIWAFIRRYYPAGLLLLLIGTFVQCTIERQNSRIAAEQSQNLTQLSEFLQSGAEVDRKVAEFNDALAEGRSATAERRAFRDALRKHAYVVMALEPQFGSDATQQYMAQLRRLSDTVEVTKSAESPGPIISQMSTVIVSRRALAARAKTQI